MLPPSFSTARTGPNRWNDCPRPAISIEYNLHALVRYHESYDTALRRVEVTKPIKFLPYTEVEPPTYTEHFPQEFVLNETIALRKHALGGGLGHMVVSAGEPPPLIYPSSASSASTECTVSVTVRPSSLPPARLRNLSFHVKPAIRAKTFYSTNILPCMPRQTDLAGKALIRLHDEVAKLAEQRFSSLKWDYMPPSSDVRGTPPAYEASAMEDSRSSFSGTSTDSSAGPTLSLGRSGSCGPHNFSPDGHRGTWRASFKLAIDPSEVLVPAFCGSLISRSYSLLFRMRVSGAHGKNCDLELPLQVVYLPPQHSVPGVVPEQPTGPCKGPAALLAQQDVSFHISRIYCLSNYGSCRICLRTEMDRRLTCIRRMEE